MDTLNFSLSPGRLVRFVIRIALLFGALTAFSLLVNHSAAMRLISLVVVMVAIFALVAAGGRTTLSTEGIRIHRFFVPMKRHPWSEVASVAEKQVRTTSTLKLQLTNGKEYTLPYPVNTTSNPDPDFAAHRDQVIAYWRKQAKASKAAGRKATKR